MLEEIGTTASGPIIRATLSDGPVSVGILNIGGVTCDWKVPVEGRATSMILGYTDANDYWTNPAYLGAIVGRVANRIEGARFQLDGATVELTANEPPHHLHGGATGLARRRWEIEMLSATSVRLSYLSPDGEEGYPGNVAFSYTISLTGARLTYDLRAQSDRPTPIALAQHSYYTLGPFANIRAHKVQVAAHRYTPVAEGGIPTGERLPVGGTKFDFTSPQVLSDADPDGAGYDINLALDPDRPSDLPAATALAPNGVRLQLWTDQPGLQLYDAAAMPKLTGGLKGQSLGRFSGLCLEPQAYPNTVNTPSFGSVICTPEIAYHQVTSVEITSPDMRQP